MRRASDLVEESFVEKYRKSVLRRIEIAKACLSSPEARAIQMVRCARDPVYWFNTFVVTKDPRLLEKGLDATVPFDLFPRQEELVRFLLDRLNAGEQGLVEKSRDSGATYVMGGFFLHQWVFKRGFEAIIGSRKEEQVDSKGNPNAIFEKIRVMYRGLPKWMMPPNFNPSKHDNHRRLINPDNESTITGEAGENMGRGGRATVYCIDESAFIEDDQSVEAAISGTANCRIYISTPHGMGNLFAKKRHGGSLRPDQIFRFHWRDDPRKDDAWAVAKKKEYIDAPWIWAGEYEIDYNASMEDVCIPAAWVAAARELHDQYKLKPIGYGIGGLDIGGGKAKSVFTARFGPLVLEPQAWGGGDTTDTAHVALQHARAKKVGVINYDSPGLGAGVASTLNHAAADVLSGTTIPGDGPIYNVRIVPINTGDQATWTTVWPDGQTSRMRFGNLKAEMWWLMRERFRCAYEHKQFLDGEEGGLEHDMSDLILLPKCNELQVQLSIPKQFRNGLGKIVIESKAQLASRGVASPDWAESLSLTFVPEAQAPVIAVPVIEMVSRQFKEFATITADRGW